MMLIRITGILLLICLGSCQVISRNKKLAEQMSKFRTQIDNYDELIEKSQTKLKDDLELCIQSAKESNCTKLRVWEHERVKHSKNITNLENKIKNHQSTIQNIITTNQEETHKKSLTIQRLLPELIKTKNDIEYIEVIQFLIKDTYLNIDNKEESIMNIFDSQLGNPIQLQLVDLMKKTQYDHYPGARPQQPDYLPEKAAEEPSPKRNDYFQGPPLIDEVIFDGHNEQYPQASVRELFNSLGGLSNSAPVADNIPDAIDVPEHDKGAKTLEDIIPDNMDQNDEAFENLQVTELQSDFKKKIKSIGQELYDKLDALRKALSIEQDRLAQAIADLEKAILNLHHRHAKQIVQIYIESKRLQRLVFEKDDTVLHLDGLIHDCTNLQQKLKNCENNKVFDLNYIQDLKQQKELNIGILKELEKLAQYADKNVETPVIPIEVVPSPQVETIKEEIQTAQEEMHQIAETEKQVEKPVEEAPEEAPEEVEEAPEETEDAKEAPEIEPSESVEEPVQIDAPVIQPVPETESAQSTQPVEEIPVEEKPAEPSEEKPAQQTEATVPAEENPAKPAEEKPAEVPAEEKQTESPATEEKPVEEKPAESPATVEEKPAESPATVEEKPAESPATVEEKPAESPATVEEKPAESPAAEEKPAEEKPAEEKPAEEKPAEEKPAEEKPAEEKPAESPVEEKPVEEKPAEQLVHLRHSKLIKKRF